MVWLSMGPPLILLLSGILCSFPQCLTLLIWTVACFSPFKQSRLCWSTRACPLSLEVNIADIRRGRKAKVPVFDLESGARSGFKELEVSEDCGVVIIEGVYALHPDIRKSLDLWVAVVGGVHSHLISRVQRDKRRAGCFISQNEIMTTVFPMFQLHIEPHLVHAHLKIRNDRSRAFP